MNNYNVYGLKIKSEIEIEEFISVEDNENSEEILIISGDMPVEIKDKIENGLNIGFSKESIWFHIPQIATYLITNGNKITVDIITDTEIKLMKVYLMCSCLGFIMLQRDMVAIHGGVIEIDNKAVIITGDRGAGKSTLTTALREKGYKFISDDVAGIEINKVPYVMPGFPYQKLCESAMNKFGYSKELCSSIRGENEEKYIVPAKEDFINKPRQLVSIIKLIVGDVNDVTIEEIKASNKMNNIIENIYRGEYIKMLGGVNPKYFKQCLDIARNINFYVVTRPQNGFTVDRQIEVIESRLLKLNEAIV